MGVNKLQSLTGGSGVHVFLVLWKAARAVEVYAEKSVSQLEMCGSDFAVLFACTSPAGQRRRAVRWREISVTTDVNASASLPPCDSESSLCTLMVAAAVPMATIAEKKNGLTQRRIRRRSHSEGSIEEPLTVLVELKRQGLIGHLGLSNVTPQQFAEAQRITEIICVQNFFNVAHRNDDAFIDALTQQGIAYVPFFPLGGFTPLQSSALNRVGAWMQATPMQVALAWLLQRSPNILLIPGTSSVEHLHENLQAAALELPSNAIAELNAIDVSVAAGQPMSFVIGDDEREPNMRGFPNPGG